MIYFLVFILGILTGIIVLTLYCCILVGAEAEIKLYEKNDYNKEDNK